MKLTFNESLKRYEFRVESRTEKDSDGRLGLAIATSARFRTAWNGRDPIFFTQNPFHAQLLAMHADDDVREQIKAEVEARGGDVPILTYKNGVYIWSGPIEGNGVMYRLIPKNADFAFTRDPGKDLPRGAGSGIFEPVWYTERAVKAMKCAEYADEAAKLAISTALARRHAALEASRAAESDIVIPVPEGLTPFGFQRAAIAYAQPRKRVLFGHEMGLGKSIMAALWINLFPEVERVLVVCPASLKRNWMRELERWLVRPTMIGIADSKYSQVIPRSPIVIINYELLSRKIDTGQTILKDGKIKKVYDHVLRESLRGKWDMLIVDEAHRAKGDVKTTIRSRMVFSLEAERAAFLSGTPIVNRPKELWNIAHYCAPKAFPSQREYHHLYCSGGNGRDPNSGASNLEALNEKIRLWFMVRCLKKDVLKDLPPKMRQVIELPADGCEKLVKGEMLAFNRKEDLLSTMRLRVELSKASEHVEDYKRAVADLTEGIRANFQDISRIRHETGLAKVDVVIEHVSSILSEGHKVIIFAHHQDVVEKIHAAFANEMVFMHGGIKVSDRQALVDRFQTDENIRGIVGNYGTMGEGYTLTASSYLVTAEQSYVPKDITQAEDRAHRIGQTESLLIQHLVLEGSLDKRMMDVLVEKQDIADRALDRESADQMLADPVTPDREKMATQGVSANDIAKAAENMSQDDIAAVQLGVRLLAGVHRDSKALLDGETFRAVDAPLGKILADTKKMTPRMAALGKRLISRYKHQLAVVPEIQRLFSREESK